jgi:aryl-alcohol dehydrogenase-like predicted oxidoreductase
MTTTHQPIAPQRPGGAGTLAGRTVARIGFGAMQLPGPGVWGPPRDRAAALALGVNHIDTAQFYGDGVANELIHAALSPYPDDLVLVTKVGANRNAQGAWIPAQRPEQLRASVEANLRTLQVERVGVVNLRLIDGGHGLQAPPEQLVDLDSQLDEMQRLRDAGKIGGIGLSNATLDHVRRALTTDIACVQNAYSLLERADEPLLELCRTHGIAWVPFFPLGSAFANRSKVTDQPEVLAAAERLGATPAQVGLAWLLAHAPDILLIPGTSRVAHLEENLGAGGVRLDARALAELDGLASRAPAARAPARA